MARIVLMLVTQEPGEAREGRCEQRLSDADREVIEEREQRASEPAGGAEHRGDDQTRPNVGRDAPCGLEAALARAQAASTDTRSKERCSLGVNTKWTLARCPEPPSQRFGEAHYEAEVARHVTWRAD